ncbi:hypothetical protein BDV19DRAFT_385488 [Aspergillus venezuelensis]
MKLQNTYDVDGIPDATPIRLHPLECFIRINSVTDLDCFPEWPLAPAPEIDERNVETMMDEYRAKLRKWREKRYRQEIDFMITLWEQGKEHVFRRPGFNQADIDALKQLKVDGYNDRTQLKLLCGDEQNEYFVGLSDQTLLGYEARLGEKESVIKKRRAPEDDERGRLTKMPEFGPEDLRMITDHDPEGAMFPRLPDPPTGVPSEIIWLFAVERHSMWEPRVTSMTQMPSCLSALGIGADSANWKDKPIDFTISAFSRLQVYHINRRGQHEVWEGYSWGIPYYVLETTARKSPNYKAGHMYKAVARTALMFIEKWYMQQSEETVQQLSMSDIRKWPLPIREGTLLNAFLEVELGGVPDLTD